MKTTPLTALLHYRKTSDRHRARCHEIETVESILTAFRTFHSTEAWNQHQGNDYRIIKLGWTDSIEHLDSTH